MVTILNQSQILNQLSSNRDYIRQLGINRIGLFGSYARGNQLSNSDIDLLIDFLPQKKSVRSIVNFIDYFEKLFNRAVDVTTFDGAQKRLYKFIKNEIKYAQI